MTKIINVATTNQADYKVSQGEKNHHIFAGNLNLEKDQTKALISHKKDFAQKQAFRLIGDAWDRDKKSSQKIEDIESERVENVSKLRALTSKVKSIESERSAVQEEYKINPDSQE